MNSQRPLLQSGTSEVTSLDPVWTRIRQEAEEAVRTEPMLASLMCAAILNQDTLEQAVAHRIASRLHHADVSGELIVQAFEDAIEADPAIGQAFRADISAVLDRDPACNRSLEPVLYFKGFHALQTHRLAHQLWTMGRRDMALYLQSRSSAVFGVDIHPNARFGKGVLIDHGTGVVIGETAVVGDNVSMLHGVNLGGNGKEHGDRHPKIGNGVLLGAYCKVLGNITVGNGSRVGAGSVVLKPVPPCVTVAGMPARIVGQAGCAEPARAMDHVFGEFHDAGADI
ncbi:MAG TPA: serine O-acetyltransferase [Azospirillaceae bacterium]|nr:serine O-acetyltransferase [Azospirillaceae bacterium]